MKPISKLIVLFVLTVFGAQTLVAQNAIDTNRMNRDIRIMENILQEMFKVQSAHGSPMSSRVRGTYLPDFGVIFMIPSEPASLFFGIGNPIENSQNLRFVYGGNEETDKVDEKSVESRIVEFLRDYGSTIGQLNDSDKVMVIYGTRTNQADRHLRHLALSYTHKDRKEVKHIPVISVTTQKRDLNAYRSGRISAEELGKSVSVSKAKESDKRQMDMKVMANIFETAFEFTEKNEFLIRGSVNYLKLDNFGALFFFDAFSSSGFAATSLLPYSIKPADVISVDVAPEKRNGIITVKTKSGEEKTVKADDLEKERKERLNRQKEEIVKNYQTFVANLKEYLVDYGRTLGSVGTNQHILVSVTLSSRFGSNEIPERVDLQIKKSVLEAMDKGSMSRVEAIKQVVVREY